MTRLRFKISTARSLREPNVGRTHRSSRVRLDQRDCRRSELHHGGCTDKSCVCLRGEAAPLLARYSADALMLEQDGGPSWMFHSTCDTSRQT